MNHKLTIGLAAAGTVFLAVGLVSCQSNSRINTATSTSAARTKKVEIVDPFFGQTAASLIIPADWAFQGTVLRGPNGTGTPAIVFRASSPDGLSGVQALPRYEWYWSNTPSLVKMYQVNKVSVMQSMPAGEFIKKVVLSEARPGAQVTNTEPLPEVSEKLPEQDRKTNAQFAGSQMTPMHVTSDAARVRIQYDFNGHPVEEWIAAVTSTMESQLRVAAGPPMHTFESQAWISAGRAPRGQLESSQPMRRAIFNSLTPEPAWTAKQNAFASQQLQAQQAQIQRQSAEALERNRRIFENSMASARRMEDARHQGAMATIDHIRDEQTVVNPGTGQVGKVSNQYNYSYVDENGRVVQTNSSAFNPNAQLRGNWTQLQPIKP